MQVYLQFGKAGEPMQTVKATDTIEAPMYHHINNLSYTASGYGSKLPTRYKIKYNNRWYRVYSICHSNVSTEYVLINGERVIVSLNDYEGE